MTDRIVRIGIFISNIVLPTRSLYDFRTSELWLKQWYFMQILTNSSYELGFYAQRKLHPHRTPFTTAHCALDESLCQESAGHRWSPSPIGATPVHSVPLGYHINKPHFSVPCSQHSTWLPQTSLFCVDSPVQHSLIIARFDRSIHKNHY